MLPILVRPGGIALAESLEPGVGDAVEEDGGRFEELGGDGLGRGRGTTVPRPPEHAEGAEVARKGQETVPEEDRACEYLLARVQAKENGRTLDSMSEAAKGRVSEALEEDSEREDAPVQIPLPARARIHRDPTEERHVRQQDERLLQQPSTDLRTRHQSRPSRLTNAGDR